jgi:DNA-binding response OmpR family regulator
MMRSPLVLVVDDEGPTEYRPDVVVLDVMLPGFDGIEVLRRIRATSDAYVLMLTARTEETDRLVGLAVGADDYVTKPFSPRELTARVKTLLRRPHMAGAGPSRQDFGRLSVDGERREVRVDEQPIDLSALEFDLLSALCAKPGQVLSRRQLLERVWGFDYFGDERVVDVHIRNLRRVLGDDADAPNWIATVRGVGYKFLEATP